VTAQIRIVKHKTTYKHATRTKTQIAKFEISKMKMHKLEALNSQMQTTSK